MSDVSILKIGNNLIVPIQVELHDRAAVKVREAILEEIERTGASGLLIDVSAVTVVDSFLGRLLGETAKMARLMGTESVLVGLKKEVVITLVQLGFSVSELRAALNIEDGLELLESLLPGKQNAAGEDEVPV